MATLRRAALALLLVTALLPPPPAAGSSEFALRFHGTGVGPPGQQDRIRIAVDDNGGGPDASTVVDVGDGDFTLELWLRGTLADNDTPNDGGDVESADFRWIYGNILLDRDVWCGTERKFGVSLAGGLVRFGTSTGDPPLDPQHTMEGSTSVLDGGWHHVAVVRHAASGIKRIYVDGALDFESTAGASTADLSYPDEGVPVTGVCETGQLTPWGWYLVVAAEKHDAGAEFPSFDGFVDELRIWTTARTPEQIAASHRRRVNPAAPGLAADYRFEEGVGTAVASATAPPAPVGELIAGQPGNGEWVSRADDAGFTAPLVDLPFADDFELGDLSLWFAMTPP